MKLRVLVVDDEQPARRRLIDLIARRPDLELAGTSADGREARADIFCCYRIHSTFLR